jgi:hypothetical protein
LLLESLSFTSSTVVSTMTKTARVLLCPNECHKWVKELKMKTIH